MENDMSFGGDLNNNKTSMSQENTFDISDLYQNEESIDLSTYMTSANLELCDDELFQSLFPSDNNTEANVKTEKPDPFESELSDWWTEPQSAYSSACSSAAQSPVQFFNTPPVTPKSDNNTLSPESLRQQIQQDRLAQFSMSRTQLTPIMLPEDHAVGSINNGIQTVPVKSDPDGPKVFVVKREDEVKKPLLPELIKAERTEPSRYEEVLYGKSLKRSIRPAMSLDDDDDDQKPAKKSRSLSKDSDEYKIKRERNNIAVRKSRDKAKMKSMETQKKVSELSNENKRLHERVAELTHELNTLKGILKSLPVSQTNLLQN